MFAKRFANENRKEFCTTDWQKKDTESSFNSFIQNVLPMKTEKVRLR